MWTGAGQCPLLVVLLTTMWLGVSGQPWSEEACDDKYEECRRLFLAGIHTCEHDNQTIHCLGSYIDHCFASAFQAAVWRNATITNHYCPGNCYPVEGATQQECINSFFPPPLMPSPSPLPVPKNCSYSPPLNLPISPRDPPVFPLGSPSLSPPVPPPPECTLPEHNTFYRQHCSLFSLSHLRTFSDRRIPLQTCVLLGETYLIKHRSLSVAVKGEFNIGNTDRVYTKLSQVRVTLHNHTCLPSSISYNASAYSDLKDSAASGLSDQILTVENGTVATILAPWINTTIVIHRTQGYLSVTLQVPEPLTRESDVDGLCMEGCPAGFDVPSTDIELDEYECAENKMSVLLMCLSLHLASPPVGTMLYSELCSYDVLLTHDLRLLSLYSALNDDALALPDVTMPPPTLPATSMPSETTPSPTEPNKGTSSVIIVAPTDQGLVSRTLARTTPLSLHILSLFALVVATLHLR